MVPLTVLQRDGVVAAFVGVVRQDVLAFVVKGQRCGDGWRSVDIRVNPNRDSVIAAPILGGKSAGGDEVLPIAAAVDAAYIKGGADSNGMLAIFYLCRG